MPSDDTWNVPKLRTPSFDACAVPVPTRVNTQRTRNDEKAFMEASMLAVNGPQRRIVLKRGRIEFYGMWIHSNMLAITEQRLRDIDQFSDRLAEPCQSSDGDEHNGRYSNYLVIQKPVADPVHKGGPDTSP